MEKISLSPSKISKKPSAIFSLFWKRARGKNSSSISFFLQVFMLLSFFFTYVFPWFLYPCWSKCACTCNIGAFFVNFWIFMSHILISSKKKKITVLWKVNCISWLLVLPYLEFLKSLQAYRFKSKQTQISLYLTIFIRLHNFYTHHVGSVFFCTVTSHP
jgi:hypothetical protein